MSDGIKELVERLRGFAARHYTAERVQMASAAADALEAMAGEVGRLKGRLRIANGVLAETTQKALELQTESDRLQLALSSLRSDNARMKAALELIWACSGDLFATEEARKALGGDE